jgi:hypothetical protein
MPAEQAFDFRACLEKCFRSSSSASSRKSSRLIHTVSRAAAGADEVAGFRARRVDGRESPGIRTKGLKYVYHPLRGVVNDIGLLVGCRRFFGRGAHGGLVLLELAELGL